jgi:hypothetical protein
MNKRIFFILAFTLLLSTTGCGSPATLPGLYTGRNPDVSFDYGKYLNGDATLIGITNFQLILPSIKIGDVSYPVTFSAPAPMHVNHDGTFSIKGIDLTGKIEGNVASGHYSGSRDNVENIVRGISLGWIELPGPVQYDLNWSATIGGTLPTTTPFPTAIPPKLGHYEGTNVSFDITASGVENLYSSLTVACPVSGEPVLKIDQNGLFSVADVANVTFFGIVDGDTVIGNWTTAGGCAVICKPGDLCSYDPNISAGGVWNVKWVRP